MKKAKISILADRISKTVGQGATVVAKSGSGVGYHPERDMMHVWHYILEEAAACAQQVLTTEKEHEILDTIVHIVASIYAGAARDNREGLSIFNQLYEYLKSEGETAGKVYALYTGFFHQAYFCYIFATAGMALGLQLPSEQDKIEYTHILNLMALVDGDDKKSLIAILKRADIWPATLNARSFFPLFKQQLDDFIEVVKQDQEARKENTALRAEDNDYPPYIPTKKEEENG